jgi:hypothetical protein
LTLITCTKNNDASQTVYIAELVWEGELIGFVFTW